MGTTRGGVCAVAPAVTVGLTFLALSSSTTRSSCGYLTHGRAVSMVPPVSLGTAKPFSTACNRRHVPSMSARRLKPSFDRLLSARAGGMDELVADMSGGGWAGVPVKSGVNVDGSPAVYLTKDVNKGSEILTLDPKGPFCLNVEKVSQSPVGEAVAALPSWAQLAAFLLYEKRQQRPEWKKFMASINLSPDQPLLWPEEDRKTLLQGTQALEVTEQYLDYVNAQWEASSRAAFESAGLSDVSLEEFVWAFCVVRANSFSPFDSEDQLTVVPVFGLLGHTRARTARIQTKSGGLFGIGGGDSANAKISIKALRDLGKDTVLSMEYAPSMSESSILVNYGKASSTTPKDAVDLKLQLSEEDNFFGDKADTLEQEGEPLSQTFMMMGNSEPSDKMQAFMRLCLLKDKDAFILEPIFRDALWNDHLQFPFSEINEEDMCNGMISWANARLTNFPGELDDDLQKQNSVFPGSREDRALTIRIGERRALENTLRFFRRRAASFSQIQFYQERRLMRLNLLTEDGRSTFDPFKDNIA
mmetsp:Transcript_15844/g.25090  ORF Transcript_15844/g.25090 Transcript_15844/m.25090 type:complete len:530 (-) Transcript_15844:244-1833(-)